VSTVSAAEKVQTGKATKVPTKAPGFMEAIPKGELKMNGWPVPDVTKAKLLQTLTRDVTPDIEGEETKVEVYLTPEGTVFNRFSIKGNYFEYLIDTDGKQPFEYAIIDTIGDGKYNLKKESDSRMYIPAWVNYERKKLK